MERIGGTSVKRLFGDRRGDAVVNLRVDSGTKVVELLGELAPLSGCVIECHSVTTRIARFYACLLRDRERTVQPNGAAGIAITAIPDCTADGC